MTDIAFHFNAPDPVAYVCRLLRKAVNSGVKVVVTGLPDTLLQLDAALWTFSPTDFLPHCHLDSSASVIATSPVLLTTLIEFVPHQQVLVNLGYVVPTCFERFERVIEVVGEDDEDRQLARNRWKQYLGLGYTMTRHDLNLKAPY